jgi:hypothetical protein
MARAGQLAGQGLHLVQPPGGYGDRRAFLRQQPGEVRAQASGRAGHNCDLTLQRRGHFLSS